MDPPSQSGDPRIAVISEGQGELDAHVSELGTRFALFTTGGKPLALGRTAELGPSATLADLRDRSRQLKPVGEEIERAVGGRLVYADLGAVLIADEKPFMINPARSLTSPQALAEMLRTGEYQLLSSFRSLPGKPGTLTPREEPREKPEPPVTPATESASSWPTVGRCPAGHWMIVPPKVCPIHHLEAKTV